LEVQVETGSTPESVVTELVQIQWPKPFHPMYQYKFFFRNPLKSFIQVHSCDRSYDETLWEPVVIVPFLFQTYK